MKSLDIKNVNWNINGPIDSPRYDQYANRASKIREKIPRIDFPISINSKGYIIWPPEKELPPKGWTLDSLGRLVGVLGKIRFFQRYTNSFFLIGDFDRDSFFTKFTKEDLDEIDLLL
jgi:hypothetical protein